MTSPTETLPRKSRLAALLGHFAEVEDPRDVRRILHPLPEVLLPVVCGTIAAWGAAHLGFLRRHLPYENGVPGERWLTILMNRINPALFAAAFSGWVHSTRQQTALSGHMRFLFLHTLAPIEILFEMPDLPIARDVRAA